MSFDGFKRLFKDNFPNFASLEVVQLYNDCFNIGGGIVHPDAFFALSIESYAFMKKTNTLGQWFNNGSKLNLSKPSPFEK
jgi:hypothetical protein